VGNRKQVYPLHVSEVKPLCRKNGQNLGVAFKNVLRVPLYPTVGLHRHVPLTYFIRAPKLGNSHLRHHKFPHTKHTSRCHASIINSEKSVCKA